MSNTELFDWLDGIPGKEDEEQSANRYYKLIANELKKLSKTDAVGQCLKAAYVVELIINQEYEENTALNYDVYVNGDTNNKLHELICTAIQNFVDEGNYAFHYYYHQLEREVPRLIDKCLNDNLNEDEYWCRLLFKGLTLSLKTTYDFIVLCFDRNGLESNVLYRGKRHPFLDALKCEWSFGEVNDIMRKKVCYNELFRRAATRCESFIYFYGNEFNALSALMYEGEANEGSILSLCGNEFEKLESNYKVCICLESPIRIEENSYKKIRKLLEITKNGLSLLMDANGGIYAIGRMTDSPSCDYYQVRFNGFLKWSLYKNSNEEYLRFENMIPRIPGQQIGITNDDIEMLKRTFNITDTSRHEKIIGRAVAQAHGTMVVFTENADDEAKRLKESGICIEPADILDGKLVTAATAIDGAIICDMDGICYSIGTILDGTTSKNADSSRGARYNSAIRYTEQQKNKKKRTFIVVVSEDGYVNCFSSLYCAE